MFVCSLVRVASSRPAPGDIIFSDGTFNPAGWSASRILDTTPSQAAFFDVDRVASGGDLGAFRRTVLNWTATGGASQGMIVGHLKAGAVYTPSARGAITSIDYSFSNILLGQVGGTREPFPDLLLFQSGSYYGQITSSTRSPTWVGRSVSGLTSADFGLISGSGPATPDFSASGTTIHFGYRTSSAATNPGSFAMTSGIDDWSVRVTAVPEPSSLVSATLGLAELIGYASRRRARSGPC